jgi:transcriptional regulator with XRE-family HTH domain
MLKHNFKRLREQAGLTQAGLAAKLKISLRTIQNWEQGHREPDLEALRVLAGVFGVSLDELVAEPPAGSAATDKPRGRRKK